MGTAELRTERLVLRQWRDSDLEPFAALNSDPAVMEHFPSALTREQSDDLAGRASAHIEEHGWGLWAVDVPDGAGFIGFVGLWPTDHLGPPAVEVGWRLARHSWGNGYAPEAATRALGYGFGTLGVAEIVSFTVPQNANSRRVMEKIGLKRRPERDFDHPTLDPDEHPALVAHVLYSATATEWRVATRP